MRKLKDLLESKKSEDNSGYRIVQKTVYSLERKDGDRWLHDSYHDSEESARLHIKKSKAGRTRLNRVMAGRRASWQNMDPGRNRIPRTPHGD